MLLIFLVTHLRESVDGSKTYFINGFFRFAINIIIVIIVTTNNTNDNHNDLAGTLLRLPSSVSQPMTLASFFAFSTKIHPRWSQMVPDTQINCKTAIVFQSVSLKFRMVENVTCSMLPTVFENFKQIVPRYFRCLFFAYKQGSLKYVCVIYI